MFAKAREENGLIAILAFKSFEGFSYVTSAPFSNKICLCPKKQLRKMG